MNQGPGQIASTLNGLMQQLDTVSNNIANSGTVGFKRSMTRFSTELEKHINQLSPEEALNAVPIKARHALDLSQGQLVHTGNSLDIALDGRGYLVLETPEGPLYTRNGILQVNQLGQLVDSAGRLIAGQNGPITIPPTINPQNVQIGMDGTLTADGTDLGRLRLVDFGDQENQLVPVGMGALQAPAGLVPSAAAELTVMQGYQEGSNVKMIEELINMMSISRMYETGVGLLRKQRDNTQALLSIANG